MHADVTLVCSKKHEFNFCFPYNNVMVEGYTIFDSTENTRYVTERKCPFHGVGMKPVRLYGDLAFNDGTKKMQLRCPVCYFSERVVFKKS